MSAERSRVECVACAIYDEPCSAHPEPTPRCRITTPHAHSSFDDPIDCPLTGGSTPNPPEATAQSAPSSLSDNRRLDQ